MSHRQRVPARTLATLIAAVFIASCAGGGHRGSPWETGEHIYKVSCAACHGANGQGTGPVAPLMTVEVPDLTRIAARRNGEFPELEIYRIVDGQAELKGHGPRHMPVWGYEFFGDDASDELAHRRATIKIDHVVAYLRSIQRAE